MSADSSRISPTAHYTAYVWFRNGLSYPALVTPLGRAMHAVLALPNVAMRMSGRADMDANLLARHRLIDERLERAVTAGRIGQILEIAAGMSPRGVRFARRHPELRYFEADLPGMAAHKLGALDRAGLRGANHEVVEIDALADVGPASLAAIAARFDARRGLAIVTEGLINYFDGESVAAMWRRFAAVLAEFPTGLYLSDDVLGAEGRSLPFRAFASALSTLLGARLQTHHLDEAACREALAAAGFAHAEVLTPDPGGRHLVRILEASTGPRG